ncbi:MAG: dusA [Gammaproteobacteria bacterium]|nr:dusA [Gammaproteobacteria bacterium]
MMDCTDRHDRYFLRLLAPHVLLYTEMITTQALIHGDYQRLLAFDSFEHPIALQLGGNDPTQLAQCAKLGERLGYDEININIGCPSNRVKSGQFGACLMLNPVLVADCVFAMCQAVTIPITVKCRIGVDHHDSYEELHQFIKKVASAGCKIFIIHARKAWLTGLSPKQNRHIPPLRYDIVRKIKQDFPQLIIIINGGINTLTDIKNHLQFVDGVMIGREAYSNPYFLAEIEKQYFGSDMSTRHAIIEKFIPYIEKQLADKVKLTMITRHILGLFQGQAGARNWRRYISENAHKAGADTKILKEALHYV